MRVRTKTTKEAFRREEDFTFAGLDEPPKSVFLPGVRSSRSDKLSATPLHVDGHVERGKPIRAAIPLVANVMTAAAQGLTPKEFAYRWRHIRRLNQASLRLSPKSCGLVQDDRHSPSQSRSLNCHMYRYRIACAIGIWRMLMIEWRGTRPSHIFKNAVLVASSITKRTSATCRCCDRGRAQAPTSPQKDPRA